MSTTQPEPLCPGCGSPAVEPLEFEVVNGIKELRGACKLGHVWVTRLFEPEAS